MSSLLPDPAVRKSRQQLYGRVSWREFASVRDWFFFIHIDPVLRGWHAAGMLLGFGLFAFAPWQPWLTFPGLFCFYGFGAVSHLVYDGAAAATPPRLFWPSFAWVIHINWLTLTGRFEQALQPIRQRNPELFARHPDAPRP